MSSRNQLTQSDVRDLFDYDETTGWLTWKNTTSNRVKAGSRAGNIDSKGYRRIGINGFQYREHQIIWLWCKGDFANHQIDHINFDRTDNRISNLRIAFRDDADNNQHRSLHKNNTSGHAGVSWHKLAKKWTARITVSRKEIYLGLFLTIDEAISAYNQAKKKFHTFSMV